MILATSQHVLRLYLEAGLGRTHGPVVPCGVDPLIYSPISKAFSYPTKKGFKFLQTSFPWINEKGFDLTIKAFGSAFSSHQDVSLILRIPRIQQPTERSSTLNRLEAQSS
jgi:glycosyltransferase involved in cell wall biosynthesis